ncbi:MAG: divergent polysaccharide deacetylase family protein [Cycloclasticus sp.]|nr:divergent polysaccharide deacetylase family protein [Cycloclasticus sp.]MBQ0789262.1 divergent polysaccharide deacetylase family protein [Cycloclasticus sp.]
MRLLVNKNSAAYRQKISAPAFILLLFVLMSCSAPAMSGDNGPKVTVSIIIDDLGYRLKEGRELIDLHDQLSYAVLPNAPYSRQLARYAQKKGKEVILHMPMQSTLGEAAETGVLAVDMDEKAVVAALQQAFSRVPTAVGMNNHQGSLLTRHPGHMAWVMKELSKNDYFFVDSRTSKQSVAGKMAIEQGVPTISRDIFLDHKVEAASIKAQFERLIQLALKEGHAVGIGHPHAETISVLREMLPLLKAENINLVPISNQLSTKLVLVEHK